jgi:hypothetical protein
MASVFKAKKSATRYTIMYYDEHGKRRKKIGYTDKRESQKYAAQLEETACKIKNGSIDPRELTYQKHHAKPLVEHLVDYERYIVNKGSGEKHAQMTINRAKRVLGGCPGRS